jgi:PAS domain S-box-containing protein
MRILAIDDNADNLVSIEALLKSCLPGCETETARSGPEGIEKARTFQPDTILLDVRMPGMDGFESCRVLKGDPATCHIPVVFLTAQQGDSQTRARGLEIGGDAFLTKPVETAELTAQVRAMVRIKKAEDALRAEKDSLERAVDERSGELLESGKTLRAMIDAISESVSLMDRDGVLLVVNETFAVRVGRRVDECTGRPIRTLVPEDVASRRWSWVEEVLRTGLPVTREDRREERWVRHSLFPILDADGSVSRIAVFGVDVTEPRRVEEALLEQLDELRRWHEATLGREGRILELKREVNELLAGTGQAPRYASALEEAGSQRTDA